MIEMVSVRYVGEGEGTNRFVLIVRHVRLSRREEREEGEGEERERRREVLGRIGSKQHVCFLNEAEFDTRLLWPATSLELALR